MQTLESLVRKISSADDLRSVVGTMKSLAAVGIRQYERAVDSLTEYARTVEMGLQVAMRNRPEFSERITDDRQGTCALVFGSDQGMCGQFNETIAAFALERSAPSHLIAVGARVETRLLEMGGNVDEVFSVPGSLGAITPTVQDLLVRVEELRSSRTISRFLLYYNRLKGGAVTEPQENRLLPVETSFLHGLVRRPWPGNSLPTHTLEWGPLFASLIREFIFVSLYRALGESLAAENSSRLASMQAAENNIDELLEHLRADYNGLRQTAITEELLDIISGFEALENRSDF